MNKQAFHCRKRFNRGLTLLELMISVSVLMGVIAMATGIFLATSRNQTSIRAENVMKTQTQTALFRLASKLNQARMLMSNDALGNSYFNHLNLSTAPPKLLPADLDTVLPTIRTEGSLSPEKNCTDSPDNFFRSNIAGNSLLFARYVGKFSDFTLQDDAATAGMDEALTGKRGLDVYEFKFIYLTDDRNSSKTWFLDSWYKNPAIMRRLRLVEWTSKRYVDYDQLLDYLTDSNNANRSAIRTALTNAGITTAWRRSGTVYTDNIPAGSGNADIFYTVGAGTAATLTRASDHSIAQQSALSLMRYDQDIYSVSYNTQPVRSSPRFFPARNQIPLFYNDSPPACNGALPLPGTTPNDTPTAGKNGFPGGFEVSIVGPASGRSVLVRIATVAVRGGGQPMVDHADSLTAYARDL